MKPAPEYNKTTNFFERNRFMAHIRVAFANQFDMNDTDVHIYYVNDDDRIIVMIPAEHGDHHMYECEVGDNDPIFYHSSDQMYREFDPTRTVRTVVVQPEPLDDYENDDVTGIHNRAIRDAFAAKYKLTHEEVTVLRSDDDETITVVVRVNENSHHTWFMQIGSDDDDYHFERVQSVRYPITEPDVVRVPFPDTPND